MITAFLTYAGKIGNARHFWMHLALADLRAKYRRSWLGLGWSILQPLAMTALLALVMGRIFHLNMHSYAPYIFSGLILWEFIYIAAISGCTAFVNAQSYIKQFTHPFAIYTLRSVFASVINLLLAFTGLIVWILIVEPANFNWSWLELPLALAFIFIIAWPLSTITAFIGVRFHDFVQLAIILMQAIWYVSPVFFPIEAYTNARLGFLIHYNPIYHLLQLFRAPLLFGQWPSAQNYYYVLVSALILWIIAVLMIRLSEKKTVFYL